MMTLLTVKQFNLLHNFTEAFKALPASKEKCEASKDLVKFLESLQEEY